MKSLIWFVGYFCFALIISCEAKQSLDKVAAEILKRAGNFYNKNMKDLTKQYRDAGAQDLKCSDFKTNNPIDATLSTTKSTKSSFCDRENVSLLQQKNEEFLSIVLKAASLTQKNCGHNDDLLKSLTNALNTMKNGGFENKVMSKPCPFFARGDDDQYIDINEDTCMYTGPIKPKKKNQVITGLRFKKHNNAIYLQIQSGEILGYGLIKPSSLKWNKKPPADLQKKCHKIDKSKLSQSTAHLNATKQQVLTGLQFEVRNDYLKLSALTNTFKYSEGKLVGRQEKVSAPTIEKAPSDIYGFSKMPVNVRTMSGGIGMAYDSDLKLIVPRLVATNMILALETEEISNRRFTVVR